MIATPGDLVRTRLMTPPVFGLGDGQVEMKFVKDIPQRVFEKRKIEIRGFTDVEMASKK